MNIRPIKNIDKERGWKVFDPSNLKHVQSEIKRTAGSTSRSQIIELSDRLLKGAASAEFEGKNTYRHVLTEAMSWVTKIDCSSRIGLEGNMMYELNQDDVNMLLDNYQIDDMDSVCIFITENNFPCSFLEEAANQIKRVFKGSATIQLSVINDTTLFADGGLFASIISNCSVEDAVNNISILDKEWFIPHPNMNKKRFMFDVDWA